MAMRVTTNMAMNLYRYNLGNSNYKMNNSMNKLSTQRRFDSFVEDPTSAVQAWRIRRAMVDNANYQDNNKDTVNRFNVAFATMGMVTNKLVDEAANDARVRGMNDPTAGARVQVGQVLKNTADSVIEAMNGAKYGDHFIFSGEDEMNAPFSWDGDKLYYRGINVNAGSVKNPAERPLPSWALDDAGNEQFVRQVADLPANMPATGKDADEQEWIDYYKSVKAELEGGGTPAAKPIPGTAVPAWANDGNGQAVNLALDNRVPEGMPAKSDDLYEQAWIDYCNDQVKAANDQNYTPTVIKPSLSPNDQGMAWGEPNEFGVPEAANNVTDQDTAYNRMWAEYYKDQGDVKRLDKLADEEQNVDLGMGLDEKNGSLVKGSAFDRSLPGIKMLGYGVDENGDPNNVALVMKRLGEIWESCDFESGDYPSEELEAEATRLFDKLNLCHDDCISQYAEITTKSKYLEENQDRMGLQGAYLNEDLTSLEDIEPAEAISNFMYDYYCYNAALKVGTQLLSQSLIDYMN